MKKIMTCASLALIIGSICFSSDIPDLERFLPDSFFPVVPPPFNSYKGAKDDTYWTNTDYYRNLGGYTTLGLLARRSDVIGVGLVNNCGDTHFTVTVDHALVGCTNGAVIVVHEGCDEPPGSGDKNAYMPTNNSRIVFAVYTNDYGGGGWMYWNSPEYPRTPESIRPQLEMRFLNRSWWPVERDDGVLFTQFTNVLQAVRFDRNWTNYFELCRDGANSSSNRVREDSHWDLRRLAMFSTDEQMQFILNDPLVDQSHKDCLLTPTWRGRPDL